jgi:hypothetical protein
MRSLDEEIDERVGDQLPGSHARERPSTSSTYPSDSSPGGDPPRPRQPLSRFALRCASRDDHLVHQVVMRDAPGPSAVATRASGLRAPLDPDGREVSLNLTVDRRQDLADISVRQGRPVTDVDVHEKPSKTRAHEARRTARRARAARERRKRSRGGECRSSLCYARDRLGNSSPRAASLTSTCDSWIACARSPDSVSTRFASPR